MTKISVQRTYTGHYSELEGICVDGDEGVFAVCPLPEEDLVLFAAGDDGHWREIAVYNKWWLPKIIEALQEVSR